MAELSTGDMSGRASEILEQWRKDQQHQTDPRLSLVDNTFTRASSMWASPMTMASSSQGGVTLVTDPDETDLFSEGHSLELDETVLVGGRRIHSLRQQLLTACRQKEELQITVQRAFYTISHRIDEVTALCHAIGTEEFPTLAGKHSSPNLRHSRLQKSLSPAPTYSHLINNSTLSGNTNSIASFNISNNVKIEDQAVFHNILIGLEQDIPQSIHGLETIIRQRLSQARLHIEHLQQEDEKKRSNQRQQWMDEADQRRKEMEACQREFETLQSQMKEAVQQLKQTETLWTMKQRECEDIDILYEQRFKDIDLLQHKTQEKKSQLTILEASLHSQKDELKLERKTILQQKMQLEQDLKSFQVELEIMDQKRKEMTIVQTELLELQVLQRTKEEELEQREYKLNSEKQTVQQIQSQIQKEKEDLEIRQCELNRQTMDLQYREAQIQRQLDTFTEEQDHFFQRLTALEQRERELDNDRSDLQKIQTQFAKAVSLAKTDIENQRISINHEQRKFMEEQLEEREGYKKWLENITQIKLDHEKRISHLKIDQNLLENELLNLRDEIEKSTVLRDEKTEELSTFKKRSDEIQSKYSELQHKFSTLDEIISKRERDLDRMVTTIREEEDKVQEFENKRRVLQDNCDTLSIQRDDLQSDIDKLTERLKLTQQELTLKEDERKLQSELTWEDIRRQEATLKSQLKDLRLMEENLTSEKQSLGQRQAKLYETESKLKNVAQILKAREKAVSEREEKEKTSRELDLKKLIIQLKEMIETEKHRFHALIQEKDKLEEESKAKDVALLRLQNICLTEEKSCNETSSSDSQSACARIRRMTLYLKEKDDSLLKKSEILQSKVLQCAECERSLMEWQSELESIASSLVQISNQAVR